ncbi:amidohydrolase, partial [Rhodococcus sp. MS16]
EVWIYEDRVYPYIGLNAVAGKKPEEYGAEPTRYEDMIAGCFDPKARVLDMDIDGVQAGLSFPSFPRFAGTVFLEGKDRELALLSVKAWNDYHIDEWCASAPDRLIPLVILPLWSVEECVKEVYRTAAKGAKAISFPENPVPLGLPSFHTDHWDPLFSACEDVDIPLTVHFGTSGKAPITAPEAPMAVMTALFGCNSMYATADLLFSPVFHRHPTLKFLLSE